MVTEIVELPRKKIATDLYVALALAAGTIPPYANDRTASRHLGEVKHMPAQLVLRWVTASEMSSSFFVFVCGGCADMNGGRGSDPYTFDVKLSL